MEIMIVDDEPQVAEVLATSLRASGTHELTLTTLSDDGVRVTVSTPDENDAFLAAAGGFVP